MNASACITKLLIATGLLLLPSFRANAEVDNFPFYLTGSGTYPASSSTGFAEGIITMQTGASDIITVNITSYSLTSPINEILFGFQYDPHSGSSLEWPLTGNLSASGSYNSSLGLNPSVAPDILHSLQTDQATMLIGTVDHPIVGQNGGEVGGIVNEVPVPEVSRTLILFIVSLVVLLPLRAFAKSAV